MFLSHGNAKICTRILEGSAQDFRRRPSEYRDRGYLGAVVAP